MPTQPARYIMMGPELCLMPSSTRYGVRYIGKAQTLTNLFQQIKTEVRIKLHANGYKMHEGPVRTEIEDIWKVTIVVKNLRVEGVRWSKPNLGMVKLNIDGSRGMGKGYWGAAIRDYEGKVCRAAYGIWYRFALMR